MAHSHRGFGHLTCTTQPDTLARQTQGGFHAIRDLVIAQALDISCQSSMFLKMPPRARHGNPATTSGSTTVISWQLLLDEHPHPSHCTNFPTGTQSRYSARPTIDGSRSTVTRLLIGLAERLACPANARAAGDYSHTTHELSKSTTSDVFPSAGADLRDSPWS